MPVSREISTCSSAGPRLIARSPRSIAPDRCRRAFLAPNWLPSSQNCARKSA
jgi:hypothetical protein